MSGELDRPVSSTLLYVPRNVGIENQRLVWRDKRWNSTPIRVSPDARLLMNFLELETASEVAICGYAQRFGVLGICKHGLPRTHASSTDGLICGFCPVEPLIQSEPDVSASEPISVWRTRAAQARAIVEFATLLHQKRCVEDARLWMTAMSMAPDLELVASWDEQTPFLAAAVNSWLELGGVRPVLVWEGASPATVVLGTQGYSFWQPGGWRKPDPACDMSFLQGTTLFPALACQLLLAVGRTSGFVLCSACGKTYVPKRRPNPSRRRYCEKCGSRAAWRDAQQDLRNKRRLPRPSVSKRVD